MSVIVTSIRHLRIIEGECKKIKCASPNSNVLLIEASSEVKRAIAKFERLAVAEGITNTEDAL